MHKDIVKAYNNNQYELTETGGVLIPKLGVGVDGVFHHWLGKGGKNAEGADFQESPNIVVNQGLNYFLDSALSGGTVFTTWYIAPFKANYTPLAGDTGTDFPTGAKGDEATEYDELNRVTWVDAGPSAQSITNSAAPSVFTFNASVSVYGAFMVSGSTKSSTSDTLLAASRFAAVRNLVATDILNVTYTLNIADV